MPIENKGFGALFAEKKNALDHLQQRMASILPSMPGMPVAKYFDLAIGVDFHPTVWPPSPLMPVPHVGMIFDIMGALMTAVAAVMPKPSSDPNAPTTVSSIASAVVNAMKPTVKVHNQWVANAGTGIQHLPGIVLHPIPVVTPMATSEMFMGSSTVLADGGPWSTQFHPALSCNLVGLPSMPRLNKGAKPKVALMAPTSMLLTITSGGAPVLVGGPPTIDLFQLMFKLALKGLGKLWKKIAGKVGSFLTSRFPRLAAILERIKCRLFGEPVDAATGRVTANNTDFELPGPIPLKWERNYYSDAEVKGPLGYNWHHSYNMGLFDMGNGYFTLRLADGRETVLPQTGIGEMHFSRQEQLLWQKDLVGYFVTDADKLIYRFNGAKNADGYTALSSIENKQGFAIRFDHDKQGLLKQITDSSNRIIKVENNDSGHITRLYTYNKEQEITLVSYAYDAENNLTQISNALHAGRYYHYDGHLLVKYTNPGGLNFYWEYEGKGDHARCIHTWGDGGILEYWAQYEEGKTTTRNSLGHTTGYYYDAKKLIYKIADANGGITRQVYNEYDELAVTTDPEGLSVKNMYNDWGKITKRINQNDESEKYTYDAQMNLTSISSAEGTRKHWQYDDTGRIKRSTGADGNSLQYGYKGMLLTCITDNRKRIYHFEYDAQYNLVKFIYPNGSSRSWSYDDLGRATKATDIDGNSTYYSYDNAGNVVWIHEADGNEHRFGYDAAGNLTDAKDKGHHVQFRYGPLGTLISRMQSGSSVTFAYDTELHLRSIANEGGEIYRFGMDALGQVVNEWGFDGLHRIYIRDGAGRVKKILRPGERWSSYDYDGTGNIVKEEHSDGSMAAYRYNNDGLLVEALNQDGRIALKRDSAGRVVKELQGQHEVTKKYDDSGNNIFIGSSLGAAIKMQHDAEGSLESMEAAAGNDTWTSRWKRNDRGLEVQRNLSGGIEVKTERDNFGRIERSSIDAAGIEQSRIRYVWDKSFRLQRMINELNRTQVNYDYNVFDHLISAEYRETSGAETIYRMPDKIGNVYKKQDCTDRVYGKGGQLQECPAFYYHYDREGNLSCKEFKKNERSSAKDIREFAIKKGIKLRGSGTGWLYEWAGNGMLQQVVSPNNLVTKFSYDPLGRRIAKIHKNKITRWLWNGNVPLHEWSYEGSFPPKMTVGEDGKMLQEKEPVENLVTWVFEDGTFVPCAKLAGNEKYSIVADHLGTPTHAFDDKGNKIWYRQLDCYGRSRKVEGDKKFCPYVYQGQYEDAETGLAYNRFRYYDNDLGSYISQDPIGLLGGMAAYQYVKNPNLWTDKLGLSEGLVDGAPLPDDSSLFRNPMGQSGADAFNFNPRELNAIDAGKMNPPGISVIRANNAQDAANTWNRAFPDRQIEASALRETSAADIRAAGFDVIHNPSRGGLGDKHARLIHPEGKAGFSAENRARLDATFHC